MSKDGYEAFNQVTVDQRNVQLSDTGERSSLATASLANGLIPDTDGRVVPTMARPLTRTGGLPVIVHCHLRWDFVWQRPQQIFSRLAAKHPIAFIEEPVWQDGKARIDVSEPYPNVVRLVPVLPNSEKNSSIGAQCAMILPLLHRAFAGHPLLRGRFISPIQWFYSPVTAPYFIDAFDAVCTVYDCMDELAQFRFAPPTLKEAEQLLISKADVVFTGGYQLFESKSRYHPNVHFYGCGVDSAHFSKARLPETELPGEVVNLAKPIFGYFGVIDERLDYSLLAELARQMPEDSIVMVGPFAKVEHESLPKLSNIHWLGQRRYSDLPALVKSFDVCLMPFALNEATQYINPTKTLEYMAAGKPVVSTAVPDVLHHFTPIVDVGLTADEFIAAVQRAVRRPRADLIAQGIQRANAASWNSVVSAMRGHMLDSLRANRDAPAPQSAFP